MEEQPTSFKIGFLSFHYFSEKNLEYWTVNRDFQTFNDFGIEIT